ncbi:MAG: NB-ARC domain-containing protein, partial [Anaerolineae bacterium]
MTEPGKYKLKFGANAQGTVVGDNTRVYQHFYASPAQAPRPVAPNPPDGFCGRGLFLDELAQWLDTQPARPVLGIWGPPGIGKSASGSALAQLVQYPDGCIWVDVRQAQGNYRTLLDMLAYAVGDDPSQFSATAALTERVRSRLDPKRILLVLDNAAEREQIAPILDLVHYPQSAVLFTTRSREVAAEMAEYSVELPPLAPESACALLLHHAALPADAEVDELVSRLGGVPFVIQSIGRQIRRTRPENRLETVRELLDQLADPKYLLDLYGDRVTYRELMMLSLHAIPPQAQTILRVMGLLGQQPVARSTLRGILGWGEHALAVALETLVDAALIEEDTYSNYLLPAVIRALVDEREQNVTAEPGLYQQALAYFHDWAQQFDRSRSVAEQNNELAHLLTLFDLALDRHDWAGAGQLTAFSEHPTEVTGSFAAIVNTNWPMAQLAVSLETGCLMDRVDLRGSKWNGDVHVGRGWLRDLRLAGANLKDLYATDTVLTAVDFRGGQCRDFYFTGCLIDSLDFRGASIEDVYCTDCRIINLRVDEASVRNWYFMDSTIVGTDFSRADFNSAFLNGRYLL